MKAAFIGLSNGHLQHLYQMMQDSPDWEISAICEEAPETAARLESEKNFKITHTDFSEMLEHADFDTLAMGEYFGIRGSRAIAALKRGKHVIADKPLCISLNELDEIQRLAEEKNLKVGIMLDLRHHPKFTAVRDMLQAGRIGDVQMIQFGGQHGLSYGIRPHWYFEEGKHGGTINDLGIHGLDAVEFMTGKKITELTAARTWNAFADQEPQFHDGANFMFVLENGCNVMGDVSYSMPKGFKGGSFFGWRFTLWGKTGVIEFNYNLEMPIRIYDANGIEEIIPEKSTELDYLEILGKEISGGTHPYGTEQALNITRKALELQKKAN